MKENLQWRVVRCSGVEVTEGECTVAIIRWEARVIELGDASDTYLDMHPFLLARSLVSRLGHVGVAFKVESVVHVEMYGMQVQIHVSSRM